MVLQRGIMKDYFKLGLLMRINTEISFENEHANEEIEKIKDP